MVYRVLHVVTDLLPLSTEAPRCSDFARTIGLLPPGTGLFLRRAMLVAVPTPWPKPALDHPLLAGPSRRLNDALVPTRVFACEPTDGDLVVEIHERAGAGAVLHRFRPQDPDALDRLADAVAGADVGELSGLVVPGAPRDAETGQSKPTFLVCTQGSHDDCCGVEGTALADVLRESRPDYTVRRVSHTGGHRFAPTLLAFPEGRMWAYADVPLLDRVVQGTTTGEDHRTRSRGWWGARPGPAQVAEIAVRAEQPGDPFTEPHIRPEPADAASPSSFVVESAGRTWRVQVQVRRLVPSIACAAPGGKPTKPGREFTWEVEELESPDNTGARSEGGSEPGSSTPSGSTAPTADARLAP